MLLAAGHTKGSKQEVAYFQGRTRCWGLSQRRYSSSSKPLGPGIHPSPSQDQHGDIAMSNAHMGPGVRYTPYCIPTYCHKGEQIRGNVEGERKLPEAETEGNRHDGTIRRWYKITISIFDSPSALPHSVHKERKPKKVKPIKVMRKERYDARQEALDLLRRPSDPGVADNSNFRAEGVVTHDTQMGSNLASAMIVPLPMDEENMAKLLPFNSNDNKLYQLVDHTDTKQKVPNIKSLDPSKNESEGELDKVKGLEPEEMCSDTFQDNSVNISTLLELFPKLLRLDGQELPPSVVCDTEEHKNLPFFKGDTFGSETVKNLILKFLKQYYWIYDYGHRQGLLGAYHSEACFSLFIPFNPQDPASLATYFRYSRNMKTCKDPNLRVRLLKHTKPDIVDFLSALPRTQHDLSSFLVDVCVQTEKMLCFSVNGLFKEVEGMCQLRVYAFTRIFILTSDNNSNFYIVNDQLSLRDASPTETQSAFPPQCAYSPITPYPPPPQEQRDMVQSFSASLMKLECSQKL